MPMRKGEWRKNNRGRMVRVKPRRERVTDTGRRGLQEPQPSTRLEALKCALAEIDFGFTVFFTDERGQSIKYYSGAVVQEEARS